MKQSTDFAKHISGFLGNFLTNEKGVSNNTIKSYSYTFILFINYMHGVKKSILTNYPLSTSQSRLSLIFLTGFKVTGIVVMPHAISDWQQYLHLSNMQNT